MRLIPAIDLRGGRCVRLLHGDFNRETRYEADADELLGIYRALGADWLHVVDLDAARDGASVNRPLICALAARRLVNLQVGGGLRDSASIAQMLELGAARAVIGSAALTHPAEVRAWLEHFGCERLTLAFDVRLDSSATPRVTTHGWLRQSELSLWEALAPYAGTGLKHVLCTDVGRDGALSGPNVELYRSAVQRCPQLHWQASGGIRNAEDLHTLRSVGAAAAVSGKALLDKLIPPRELRPFLPNA